MLQVIARNSDWFIALSSLVVIGRSYYFGSGFSTVIWKPLEKKMCIDAALQNLSLTSVLT